MREKVKLLMIDVRQQGETERRNLMKEWFEWSDKVKETTDELREKCEPRDKAESTLMQLSKMLKKKERKLERKKETYVEMTEDQRMEIAEMKDDIKMMREVMKVKQLEKGQLDQEVNVFPSQSMASTILIEATPREHTAEDVKRVEQIVMERRRIVAEKNKKLEGEKARKLYIKAHEEEVLTALSQMILEIQEKGKEDMDQIKEEEL
ncbi:hypothetical protein CAEBREN_09980 [Caenorhabditis brenneri]|uniref:Uncharacterized protein n=1 Tax=Caenorhabditis brenneri TaxID=135651 RepID=G0P301_CAEBE|nr:hypothetical protein CAEBREN_09980 [Caenorhabditis brenneri]